MGRKVQERECDVVLKRGDAVSEVFSTDRYIIVNASADDIPYVMEMERKEENRNYVFQNSFEEHRELISSSHEMVFIALEKD